MLCLTELWLLHLTALFTLHVHQTFHVLIARCTPTGHLTWISSVYGCSKAKYILCLLVAVTGSCQTLHGVDLWGAAQRPPPPFSLCHPGYCAIHHMVRVNCHVYEMQWLGNSDFNQLTPTCADVQSPRYRFCTACWCCAQCKAAAWIHCGDTAAVHQH